MRVKNKFSIRVNIVGGVKTQKKVKAKPYGFIYRMRFKNGKEISNEELCEEIEDFLNWRLKCIETGMA